RARRAPSPSLRPAPARGRPRPLPRLRVRLRHRVPVPPSVRDSPMSSDAFGFEIVAEDGAARRGVIRTPHGSLETPGFFAVATRAALKSLDPEAARRAGVQALIANTYHLEMQPGAGRVGSAGGLHRLMGWEGVL